MTIRFTLVLLSALVITSPSRAGERVHNVVPGETLGDIAELYYGDAQRTHVIQLYNQLESARIQVGSDLSIPVVDEHIVSSGESWSSLSTRYWGEAALHQELARQVGGAPDAQLRVGQKLTIPVLIPYRIKSGETLAAVSRRFYGHPQQAEPLARMNGIREPRRLQVGTRVRVPLADLGPGPAIPAVARAEVPQVSAAPPQSAPTQQASFGGPLRRAINAYLDGSYELALERLEGLRPRVLAEGKPSEQGLLLRHLVFVYTAFDRDPEACESYLALREIHPEYEWDPDEVSPKILRVVAGCEGG
jgi:LysM repeat protein